MDPQEREQRKEAAAQEMFGKPFAELDAHERVRGALLPLWGGGVEWSGVQRGTHAAMQQRASLLARARWTRRRVVRCRAS